jgi:uncharacterized protein (DUF2062 family)
MNYFKNKFRAIFQLKETPHRIALAFAFGVFVGISPFLGLHYAGGIFVAWLFRLNKLVAIIGISVSNPWTIVPISSFAVWLGAKILNIKQVLPDVDWTSISLSGIISRFSDMDNLLNLINRLMPFLKAFFAGSFILCTISAILSYFIILKLIARYKTIHHAA